MKLNRCLPLVITLVFAACAAQPLSDAERSVRILRKSDPPASCKVLGKVHSPGLAAWTEEAREENLKRETFKVGGDTVTSDRVDENNTIFGTAYKCGASPN